MTLAETILILSTVAFILSKAFDHFMASCRDAPAVAEIPDLDDKPEKDA